MCKYLYITRLDNQSRFFQLGQNNGKQFDALPHSKSETNINTYPNVHYITQIQVYTIQ